MSKWRNGISEAEKKEYEVLAEEQRMAYFKKHEEVVSRQNNIRREIYELQYGEKNSAVKSTGKLRFLSAYRFFRKEEVPLIKANHPNLEGKERHALVKLRWKNLT